MVDSYAPVGNLLKLDIDGLKSGWFSSDRLNFDPCMASPTQKKSIKLLTSVGILEKISRSVAAANWRDQL